MGFQIHSSHSQILFKIPAFSQIPTKLQYTTMSSISISTVIPEQTPKPDVYHVKFKTLEACKLGISRYPDFEYNAQGGKGSGVGKKMVGVDFNGETSVDFDVKTLYIPPLTSLTTKFLGLPLPPFLKIEIVPEIFRGIINIESGQIDMVMVNCQIFIDEFYEGSNAVGGARSNTGGCVEVVVKLNMECHVFQVDLKFKAKFWFSVGSIYKAPPLLVETLLTSEKSEGSLRNGNGERLDEQGKCKLVGVATVEQIDDFLMNSFLDLPTECLAVLNATIIFSTD